MNRALVIGEDALCCALGEKLIRSCVPHLNLDTSINKNGRTKLFPELRSPPPLDFLGHALAGS